MAHPVVVAVWSSSGEAWPTNSVELSAGIGGSVRALLTLRPTASDLLSSVRGGTAAAPLRPNARISIAAVVRRPPILLEYRRFSAVIEPAEVALTTGHTLVTVPRQILRRFSGTWKQVRFTHLAAVDPLDWPLCAAAEASVAAALPPCSICGRFSQDIDRCLCPAHLLADAAEAINVHCGRPEY